MPVPLPLPVGYFVQLLLGVLVYGIMGRAKLVASASGTRAFSRRHYAGVRELWRKITKLQTERSTVDKAENYGTKLSTRTIQYTVRDTT